jgi:hypothetical protein
MESGIRPPIFLTRQPVDFFLNCAGNLRQSRAFYGFAPRVRMSSSKYHRKQAEILAGLALSTDDVTKAEQFKLAAMEQLDRAQSAEDTEPAHLMPPTPTRSGRF